MMFGCVDLPRLLPHLPVWRLGLPGFLVLITVHPIFAMRPWQDPAIDIAQAKQYFSEAQEIFATDAGRLWGISLDGPLMFVERDSRIVVANQSDEEHQLHEVDGVFSGRLPPDVMIANTAMDWSGTRWTMVMWPLPDNENERKILLAHEAWHRIQDGLGFPASGASNDHLNTLDGRYLLQLEWRALSRAVQTSGATRNQSIADALHFRDYRHQLFPGSDRQEREMEMHEGLAEYTGVRLALNPATQVSRTVDVLNDRPAQLETFVRSFAYLSGPAYGILLDDLQSDWMSHLNADSDPGKLLQQAAKVSLSEDLQEYVAEQSSVYDGNSLWLHEKQKDEEQKQLIHGYVEKFVNGPRLIIPLQDMQMSFNPNELIPLGESGTVYPTLSITDRWGVLKVTGGAMISSDFRQVVVGLPADYSGLEKTAEWEVDLENGWTIKRINEKTYCISEK
jgi:hypothetical protein